MDVEKLEDAVDQARLKMYTEYGKQLGTAFTGEFTPFLAEALGVDQPTADGPQPAINIVAVEAEVVEEPNYDEHEFRPNRGGIDCIDCDMSESNGNHTVSED